MGWLDGRKNDGDDGDSGNRSWGSIIHGSDSRGEEVSASFGRDDGPQSGHTLISDGHKDTGTFYGAKGSQEHDHHDGSGGGDDRGKYSG